MPESINPAVQALCQAILTFGEKHPEAVCQFSMGQRVINQGSQGDTCFLIREGAVSVLVRPSGSSNEIQVALRTEGGLIGETSFLQRQAPRNASVEVISATATLIKLSRRDIFGLLRDDPRLTNAITMLWELAASRREETLEVLDGQIKIENRVASVLLADIHNFTALGEATWEEQSNSFLFDFVEQSELISEEMNGVYEDQGDGSKVIFLGDQHVERAISSTIKILNAFTDLRSRWVKRNDAFSNIGLGIGVCTDCMSVRSRVSTPQGKARVLSHAINIAAEISKYRVRSDDVCAYTDENTALMATENDYNLDGPQNKLLGRLGRIYPMYRIEPKPVPAVHHIGHGVMAVGLSDKISILFLAAEPTDNVRLRLAAEAREIETYLHRSKHRERFSFFQKGAVRPEDLSQALLDVEPQIVHFSGHGGSSGALFFEDKLGATHAIPPDALAALFREFSATARCVILNACYSDEQASAIVKYVDYVIGMDRSISDEAAIAFSIGLYQGIGAGKSIEEAYRLGCVQIDLQVVGAGEGTTPILRKRSG